MKLFLSALLALVSVSGFAAPVNKTEKVLTQIGKGSENPHISVPIEAEIKDYKAYIASVISREYVYTTSNRRQSMGYPRTSDNSSEIVVSTGSTSQTFGVSYNERASVKFEQFEQVEPSWFYQVKITDAFRNEKMARFVESIPENVWMSPNGIAVKIALDGNHSEEIVFPSFFAWKEAKNKIFALVNRIDTVVRNISPFFRN